MLSTFLNQIQTYFSKYFIIGNFFPMLAFAFVNGMAAYLIFHSWRSWVDANLFDASAKHGAFFTASVIVGIILAAYVLSSLNTFLRRLLEGKWWQPLATLFIPAQKRRRERLLEEINNAAMDIIDLRDADEWQKELRTARETGRSQEQNRGADFNAKTGELTNILAPLEEKGSQGTSISRAELEPCKLKIKVLLESYGAYLNQDLEEQHKRLLALIDYAQLNDSNQLKNELLTALQTAESHRRQQHKQSVKQIAKLGELLRPLDKKRNKDETIQATDFEPCLRKMNELLATYDVDSYPALDIQHRHLIGLISYANERAYGRHARMQNEVNSNFGAQEVAPTKMGNVANTIQSYAVRRYHCNLEIIWSNLQRVVQKDEKAQAALQESKTQLDFLIACCWLTLLSTASWVVILAFSEPSRWGFFLVAIGGPLISYIWYRAAAEQYRSFADVAMTTLDVFRFDLLRELHLRLPADVEDERFMWESFDQLATYGENKNFRYEKDVGRPA